ncbi:mannitol dehydrogenase family protein [Aestuariibacter sp. A3R04]|uniref:mannitol dehydrogenase family protein n=1 Tax=Aestuariibacter sp. A3R04 TaxID=2841571 RepID=UPI001C07F546|nr:mannitol dehydrogenase family protein [Aestuariibacter sp. A3R04]MBU3021692.1 mannitol dehydrogenase family protein [Aestuariibacter sp. A3R04]
MQTLKCVPLGRAQLQQLPTHVSAPGYDIDEVSTGIVHIGVGGFHRSHEAMYVNHYMAKTGDLRWGICGVGLRENDRLMKSALEGQDYLYTLVEKHANGKVKANVIGALRDFLIAQDNPALVIDRMADEKTKIVSLTITEGGYNIDPSSGNFVVDNPDIVKDIARPKSPTTVFGFLAAALKKRREAGIKPFTVMSCDNIQHNGDMAKKMLLSFIRLSDVVLAEWVEQHVDFPNSMVDRITPATTDADRDIVAELGLTDNWPVVCEPFHQWIIEDKFSNVRPDWASVGAQFVTDVAPYEKLKLRMLNAGHSVLGLVGALAGFDSIHSAMDGRGMRELLSVFMTKEVVPQLDAVKGIDVLAYRDELLSRFSNPFIKDSLARICSQSSAKIPVFLLPTVFDNLNNEGAVSVAALTLACWCYYSDKQMSQSKKALQIDDVLADELHQAASDGAADPTMFLALKTVFGDLAAHKSFTEEYVKFTQDLYSEVPVLDIVERLLNAETQRTLVMV